MTLPLPESLRDTGHIRCRIIEAIPDTPADSDFLPEAKGAVDVTVVLTPAWRVKRITDDDFPSFVRKQPWRFQVGEDGFIRDVNGRDTIALIAGTWTVSFEPENALRYQPFTVDVTTAHTDSEPLDLARAAPFTPGPGDVIQQVPLPSGGPGVLVRDAVGQLAWDQFGLAVTDNSDGTATIATDTGSLEVFTTAQDAGFPIVGPGRPDVPSTTEGRITGTEPVGTEYRSTDGAGVGAWVWQKRAPAAGGWVVVDGDTGWVSIPPATSTGTVEVRRIGGAVYLLVRGLVTEAPGGATLATLPTAFRPKGLGARGVWLGAGAARSLEVTGSGKVVMWGSSAGDNTAADVVWPVDRGWL